MSSLEQARTLFMRGLAAHGAGRPAEAEDAFRAALALAPGRVSILANLAAVLLAQGRAAEARGHAEQAAAAEPQNLEACLTLGACLLQTQEPQAALDWLDRACALRPDSAQARSNRGNALLALKRAPEALAELERAVALEPQLAEAWTNRGNALHELGQTAQAVASHDRALALQPRHARAWYNRGNALAHLRRIDEAVASFDAAIAAEPGFSDAHVNKAVTLLNHCRFAPGWAEYEWRWQNADFPSVRPATPMPEWDGRPLPGTLWLWAEQGIGDEILYLSMLDSLKPLAGRLLVSADQRLLPLLVRSHPQVTFRDRRLPVLAGEADRQLAMGSLGRLCRNSLADFAGQRAWLEPDAARVARWRERATPDGSPLCGIAWASKNPRIGAAKTVRLADLLPVLQLPGVRFADLQYGDTTAERAALHAGYGVALQHFDDLDYFNDIENLCALIAACDLVVTTSNVTTHLAGAMGRPVLQLTPRARGKLWYWHAGVDPSPWYPSVRLFEQGADGAWSAAIAAVAATAAARLTGQPAPSASR